MYTHRRTHIIDRKHPTPPRISTVPQQETVGGGKMRASEIRSLGLKGERNFSHRNRQTYRNVWIGWCVCLCVCVCS